MFVTTHMYEEKSKYKLVILGSPFTIVIESMKSEHQMTLKNKIGIFDFIFCFVRVQLQKTSAREHDSIQVCQVCHNVTMCVIKYEDMM